MHDYTSLETGILVDLLMQRTTLYTTRITERHNDHSDLTQLEYEISLIQAELNSRKMNAGNTSISDSNVTFE